MKKIFAFVLATIMVLSLVPASAFAAITKIPCKNTQHTVSNCEWTVVTTKAATCDTNGYTIYKCNACGTQFVGNVVEKGAHNWVSNPEYAVSDWTPKCTNTPVSVDHDGDSNTANISAIGWLNEICTICSKTEKHYFTVADFHAKYNTWVSGVGCEATYECAICKGLFNVNGGEAGEHAGWELVEVLSEPVYTSGKKTSGQALFACTAEGCNATKKVEIIAECTCSSIGSLAIYKRYLAGEFKIWKNAKNPTCTSDGQYAVYQCKDCNTYYRWQTTDVWHPTTAPKIEQNAAGEDILVGGTFVKITDTSTGSTKYAATINAEGQYVAGNGSKYYTIKKPKHQMDTSIPAVNNGCAGIVKTCLICKQQYTEDGHTWLETQVLLPTCEAYGVTYKSCTVCGATSSSVTDPLGHNLATQTVASTCGTYGYTFTYCKNYGKQDHKYWDQAQGKVVTVSVAKCEYTVKNSWGWSTDDIGDNNSLKTYVDPKTGITYNDIRVGKKVYPIASIAPLTSFSGSHKMTTIQILGGGNSNYCTTGYVVVEQCALCQHIAYRQVTGKAHDLVVDETRSTEATCATGGIIYTACKNCEYESVAVVPQLTTCVPEVVEIQYACSAMPVMADVKYVVCTGSGPVNVRSSATTSGNNKVGSISAGDQLAYLGDEGSFYKVTFEGQVAYVSNTVTEIITVSEPTGQTTFFVSSIDGRQYHGVRELSCACGAKTETQYFDLVGATTSNPWFETLDEAKLHHGGTWTKENGYAHAANLTRTFYKEPTCGVAGYSIYRCNTCNVNIYVTEAALPHMPTSVTVTGEVPTCTKAGVKNYNMCAQCASIVIWDAEESLWVIATAEDLVLNPHSNPATLVAMPIYTCTDVEGSTPTGYYYVCTAVDANGNTCGAIFADAECSKPLAEAPDNFSHEWEILHEGTVLTCMTDGYPTIQYCAVCKTLEKYQAVETLDENGDVVIVKLQNVGGTYFDTYFNAGTAEANTLDKNYYAIWENVERYEIPYYIDYVNGVLTVSEYKIPALGHGKTKNKLDGSNNVYVYAGTPWYTLQEKTDLNYTSRANCVDKYGYDGIVCALCDYEFLKNFVTVSGGHVNVYGEIIEATCENYAKYSERYCVACKAGIGIDGAFHNTVDLDPVAATCVSEGYTLSYCATEGCPWNEVTATAPIVAAKTYHADANHLSPSAINDYAHNNDEIWSCRACGEVVKVVPASSYNLGAGFEIYLDTEFDTYAVGSTIEVVVTVDSLKGVDVWGFSFTAGYTSKFLKFVGAEFNADSDFAGVEPSVVYGDVYVDSTYDEELDDFVDNFEYVPVGVNVLVTTVAGVEIKGEQEVMTLKFQVINNMDKDIRGEVAVPATDITVMSGALAVAPDGTDVNVNNNAAYNGTSVKLRCICDLSEDYELNIKDAYELYSILVLGGYDVRGDLNANGINDAEDLAIVYELIVGSKTLEDFFKTEEELTSDKLVQQGYDINGNPYFPILDVNENGKMDPGEINSKYMDSLINKLLGN